MILNGSWRTFLSHLNLDLKQSFKTPKLVDLSAVEEITMSKKLLLISQTDLTSRILSQTSPISLLAIKFLFSHVFESSTPCYPIDILTTSWKFGIHALGSNWRQALLSISVFGVAAIFKPLFPATINVGQLIYPNRKNTQQTCKTST